MSKPEPAARHVVGGFDTGGRVFVLALFGAVGAGAGVLLPLLARWAADLPWVPFQGPLELLSSFDQAWLVWGRPTLGLLAGLAFALWTISASPVLEITTEEVRVRRHGEVQRVIPRVKVDSIHRRGSATVIQSATGAELFADNVEGDIARLRDAFTATGYPWEGPRG